MREAFKYILFCLFSFFVLLTVDLPAALLRTVQGVGVVGNGGGKAVAKKANSGTSEEEARKNSYEVGHPLRFKPSSAVQIKRQDEITEACKGTSNG